MVFNTGPYTVLPENSILITANMQSETGFPSSHELKSYVADTSRLKLAARAVLSADAGLLVTGCFAVFCVSMCVCMFLYLAMDQGVCMYVHMTSSPCNQLVA